MKKRLSNGWGLMALLMVIACVLAVVGLWDGQRRQAEEEALQADRVRYQKEIWSDENTLMFGGERYGFDHRLETFLFIGTDNSGGEKVGEYEHQPMADFLLLMILDHTNNTIAYLPIDRNTITRVWELDVHGKDVRRREVQICGAHWYGFTPEMAAKNTERSVRFYLGEMENIDGYYVINMNDVPRLNDAVGGVQMTIEEDLTEADPAFVAGATLTMTGEQAEAFLRARMYVSDSSNAKRMGRQRQYMDALMDKVKEKALADPEFALSLWDALRSVAYTNMNGNDFSRIAQKLIKGNSLGMHQIRGETVIGYRLLDGAHEEFHPDMESVKEEMIELFSLFRVDEPDEDDEDDEEDEEEDEEDEEEENRLIPSDEAEEEDDDEDEDEGETA